MLKLDLKMKISKEIKLQYICLIIFKLIDKYRMIVVLFRAIVHETYNYPRELPPVYNIIYAWSVYAL